MLRFTGFVVSKALGGSTPMGRKARAINMELDAWASIGKWAVWALGK
jgi:hypothetical protein